uniref:Uncharacterized protein n=1 Tax=Eutreptiella gymnastica TaxID=73025 RepID=A0A7S4GPD9_9EUGL
MSGTEGAAGPSGLQAARHLSKRCNDKIKHLEFEQVEDEELQRLVEEHERDKLLKKKQAQERVRVQERVERTKMERDLSAIDTGLQMARTSWLQERQDAQRVQREKDLDVYELTCGRPYHKKLMMERLARQRIEEDEQELQMIAQARSGMRSDIDVLYKELAELGDPTALFKASEVQRALDAEEHQRLKIQRDADSDNWKKGHEAAQDANRGVHQEVSCLQLELKLLEREAEIAHAKREAQEEAEREVQRGIAQKQIDYLEMTRERASKRTPEEWASQHKAAEQARRRSVEKHALRRLAYKDPEPEIIKPLVEWSIPDTPQSKRAATPVALSSPSTAPTKAAVLSPVARLTPADRRMRENEILSEIAGQRESQRRDFHLRTSMSPAFAASSIRDLSASSIRLSPKAVLKGAKEPSFSATSSFGPASLSFAPTASCSFGPPQLESSLPAQMLAAIHLL